MTRRGMAVVVLIVVLLTTSGGCLAPDVGEPAPGALTVVDALGRSVSFDSLPERVVIAGKANFFISNAAYTFPPAQQRLVALARANQTTASFHALVDPDARDKTILTPESTAEEIATADPDLVLLKRLNRGTIGEALETLDIPVVYLDLETPGQYERDLAVLGQVFGAPARAEAVWNFYDTRLTRVAESLENVGGAPEGRGVERPTVLMTQYNARGGDVAFEVPTESWIQTQIVTLGGGEPVWTGGEGGGWTVVTLEQIAAWDPDIILVTSYFEPVDVVTATLERDANWQALRAVQQGRAYGFPGDFYSWDQPDARWILGLMWTASVLHPDRFADLDLVEETFAFYKQLYGLDRATVEAEVLPLLQGDLTP